MGDEAGAVGALVSPWFAQKGAIGGRWMAQGGVFEDSGWLCFFEFRRGFIEAPLYSMGGRRPGRCA